MREYALDHRGLFDRSDDLQLAATHVTLNIKVDRRTEDPHTIRRQVLSGATLATNAGPRREALQLALSALRSGDVLVVAGKGHEDYQIVLERDAGGLPLHDSRGRPVTKKIAFSDAIVIREIIASM